jgi:hypothetical protein
MNYIHWHNKEQPYLTYVAIEYANGHYYCEMPYLQETDYGDGSEIRTMEHAISKESFENQVTLGRWVITKRNGVAV